jgi:HK97 family phage prohead protease
MLWQHDPSTPLGVWKTVQPDDRGLKVTGKLTKGVAKADETYLLLKSGAIDGLSIGYRTIDYDIDKQKRVRMLKEVELFEISVVTMPMNELATIDDIKNLNPRILEELLREELKLSARDAVSAVAIMKKHLAREAGGVGATSREDDGANLTDMLSKIRSVRAGIKQ